MRSSFGILKYFVILADLRVALFCVLEPLLVASSDLMKISHGMEAKKSMINHVFK